MGKPGQSGLQAESASSDPTTLTSFDARVALFWHCARAAIGEEAHALPYGDARPPQPTNQLIVDEDGWRDTLRGSPTDSLSRTRADRRAFARPYARLSRRACDQSDKVEAQSPEFNHLVSLRVAGPELRAACARPYSMLAHVSSGHYSRQEEGGPKDNHR